MIATALYIVAAVGGVSFILGIQANSDATTGIFASISLVAWAIVAIQAGSIEIITDTGTTVTRSAPALGWLGLGLTVVSGLGVLKGFTS